jgi:hypothetical protein
MYCRMTLSDGRTGFSLHSEADDLNDTTAFLHKDGMDGIHEFRRCLLCLSFTLDEIGFASAR